MRRLRALLHNALPQPQGISIFSSSWLGKWEHLSFPHECPSYRQSLYSRSCLQGLPFMGFRPGALVTLHRCCPWLGRQSLHRLDWPFGCLKKSWWSYLWFACSISSFLWWVCEWVLRWAHLAYWCFPEIASAWPWAIPLFCSSSSLPFHKPWCFLSNLPPICWSWPFRAQRLFSAGWFGFQAQIFCSSTLKLPSSSFLGFLPGLEPFREGFPWNFPPELLTFGSTPVCWRNSIFREWFSNLISQFLPVFP